MYADAVGLSVPLGVVRGLVRAALIIEQQGGKSAEDVSAALGWLRGHALLCRETGA